LIYGCDFDLDQGMKRVGAKGPDRERAELAVCAHGWREAGMAMAEIALRLKVSGSTAVNLVGFGRRLAAGQGRVLQWR
jgi:hypothetical protein